VESSKARFRFPEAVMTAARPSEVGVVALVEVMIVMVLAAGTEFSQRDRGVFKMVQKKTYTSNGNC
jgi:hypothetical protein